MAWEAPLSGASAGRPRARLGGPRRCVESACGQRRISLRISLSSLAFSTRQRKFFPRADFSSLLPAAAVIVFDAAFLFTARELFERMRFTRADPLQSVSSFSRYFYILTQIKPYPSSPRGVNFTYSHV